VPRPVPWRIIAFAALAIAVVLASLALWLRSNWNEGLVKAQALTRDLVVVQTAIESGDLPDMVRTLTPAAVSANALSRHTSTPAWRLLRALPRTGPVASAIGTYASATSGAINATRGLAINADEWALAWSSMPPNRAEILRAAAPKLRGLATTLSAAARTLEQVNISDLPPESQKAWEGVQSAADRAAATITAYAKVVEMLGGGGSREWLVLYLDSSQLRGAGGAATRYAVLELQSGSASLLANGDEGKFSDANIPVQGLPSDTRWHWEDAQRTWAGMTRTPHYPHAAQQAQRALALQGQSVDGVIAVDSYALRELLRSISRSDFETNVSPEWLAGVFIETLEHNRGLRDLIRLIAPLARAGHMKIWSGTPGEQAWLVEQQVAGDLTAQWTSAFAATVNDVTTPTLGSRPSITSSLELSECVDGQVEATLSLTLSDPEIGTASLPRRLVRVDFFVPVSVREVTALLDRSPLDLFRSNDLDRLVWWTYLVWDRPTRSLAVSFVIPAGGPAVAVVNGVRSSYESSSCI
jgi:hypothetical protein